MPPAAHGVCPMPPTNQCWKCVYFQRLDTHSGDCVLLDRTVHAETDAARCTRYQLDPVDGWPDDA